MMTLEDIYLRDPFILKTKSKYYMYGSRSKTLWTVADGFDCYISEDLIHWEGPVEIFKRDEQFPYDRAYWAPECYEIDGKYYLVTTMASENKKKAVYALIADNPTGPFKMHSKGSLTPDDWCAIDGALYRDDTDQLFLIFSHSFEDQPDGNMMAIPVSDDLSQSTGEPFYLFNAVEAPWARPVPFAKKAFNLDGDVYFTDGPCLHHLKDGSLINIWSSWSEQGYAVGICKSTNGSIKGPWQHLKKTLFPADGGHGMLFTTYEGQLKYLLHSPNTFEEEKPVIFDVIEQDDTLIIL